MKTRANCDLRNELQSLCISFFIVALIDLDKSKFIKHKIKVGIGFGLTYGLINVLVLVFDT